MWSQEDYNFRVVPGVVDYRLNGFTNVNIMIPIENNEYTVPAGVPLVHIIPLSDKRLKIKNHLISKQEYDMMSNHSTSFYEGWKSVKKLIRKNDTRETKCPFGFGE
jgi:hypothetical protein